MNCKFCGRDVPKGKVQCIFCKQMQSVGGGGKAGTNLYSTSVAMCDIKIVASDRLTSGPWDLVMGCNLSESGEPLNYGPERSALILLGGEPGAGKSTLALQWANAVAGIAGKDEYVLILATEESVEAITARARRLKLENQAKIRIQSMMSGEFTPSSYLDSLQVKPLMVVLDSTAVYEPTLTQECTALKLQMVACRGVMVLVHQVNKDFEFHGAMAFQHIVDATVAFVKRTDGSETREMLAIKNRMGRTNWPTVWEMGPLGLTFVGIKEELEAPMQNPKKGAKVKKEEEVREAGSSEEIEENDDEEEENLIEIPWGTLPTEEAFLAENKEPIEVEVDGETQLLQPKILWEGIIETYALWQNAGSKPVAVDACDELQDRLEFAGFCWVDE
jgi:predicted ATP-dependent serine protease